MLGMSQAQKDLRILARIHIVPDDMVIIPKTILEFIRTIEGNQKL